MLLEEIEDEEILLQLHTCHVKILFLKQGISKAILFHLSEDEINFVILFRLNIAQFNLILDMIKKILKRIQQINILIL